MKKFKKYLALLMTLGLLAGSNPANILAESLPSEELPVETDQPADEPQSTQQESDIFTS